MKQEKNSIKEPNRCSFCNDKLSSFPFKCKYCGSRFCKEHRLPENHLCLGLSRNEYIFKSEGFEDKEDYTAQKMANLVKCQNFLDKNPKNIEKLLEKAKILGNLNRPGLSLQTLDELINIDESIASAWFEKGIQLKKLSNEKNFIIHFKRASELEPENEQYKEKLKDILAQEGENQEKSRKISDGVEIEEDLFYFAKKDLSLSKFSKALVSFDKILIDQPNNPDAWCGRARCLFGLNNYNEALKSYNTAIELDSNFPSYQIEKIQTLLRLGRKIEVLEHMVKLNDNFPNDIPSLALRYLFLLKNDLKEYEKCFNKMVEIASHYPIGKYPEKTGLYPDLAIRSFLYYYDEVLEYRVWMHPRNGDSNNFSSFNTYKDALIKSIQIRHDQNDAIVELPLGLVLKNDFIPFPKRDLFPNELIGSYYEIPTDEILEKKRSEAKYPNYIDKQNVDKPSYWIKLARIEIDLDRPLKSKQYLNKAIKIDSDYFLSYYYRGISHYKLQNYEDAILDFNYAIMKRFAYSGKYGSYNIFEKTQFIGEVHEKQGNVFFQAKKFSQAKDSYNLAIMYIGNGHKVWASLSETYRKLNNDNDADISLLWAKSNFYKTVNLTKTKENPFIISKEDDRRMKLLHLDILRRDGKKIWDTFQNDQKTWDEIVEKVTILLLELGKY